MLQGLSKTLTEVEVFLWTQKCPYMLTSMLLKPILR